MAHPYRLAPAFGSTELLNDGSVGFPFDGDLRGSWASLEAGELVDIRLHRFDFDRCETIRRLSAVGPIADSMIHRLRTARP